MSINWYPGHIAKAEKKLQEQVKLVDVVVEVFDARIPNSSRYKNIEKLTLDKPRLLILNKVDLADPVKSQEWSEFLEHLTGQKVILTSASSGKDVSSIVKNAVDLGKPALDKIIEKGILPRPVRVMIVGMPNVGKSSIINKLVKTAKAKTGEKAGVTRAAHWIRVNPKLDLMDTPGVIPPRLENQKQAEKLAMVNSIGEAAYNRTEITKVLINILFNKYKSIFCEYYRIKENNEVPTLETIAVSRNLIAKKDKPDSERAASLVLSDFRQGKIGRITLENIEETEV
jgi:ribosome biogenesis GTPase A